MAALELRDEEIGVYDPAAYRAVRERLHGKPKPVVVNLPPRPRVETGEDQRGVTLYKTPIGPRRAPMVYTGDFARIRDQELAKAGVTRQEFESDQRRHHISAVRRLIWYRAATETTLSYPAIGRLSGGKDHTTILTAVERYKELVLGHPSKRCANNRARARVAWEHRKAMRRAMKIAAE